mmetsp:Transcript_13785/g.27737  ORF Transcript_13785/g.27737 Transcript_13785/m.27737 type:complete len:251 (-) Transcript_13785:2376-3128(-)
MLVPTKVTRPDLTTAPKLSSPTHAETMSRRKTRRMMRMTRTRETEIKICAGERPSFCTCASTISFCSRSHAPSNSCAETFLFPERSTTAKRPSNWPSVRSRSRAEKRRRKSARSISSSPTLPASFSSASASRVSLRSANMSAASTLSWLVGVTLCGPRGASKESSSASFSFRSRSAAISSICSLARLSFSRNARRTPDWMRAARLRAASYIAIPTVRHATRMTRMPTAYGRYADGSRTAATRNQAAIMHT